MVIDYGICLYWVGNPFIEFRLYMTLIWLAETNRAGGVLVSIGLYLALGVVLGSRAGDTFGAWLLNIMCLRGNTS